MQRIMSEYQLGKLVASVPLVLQSLVPVEVARSIWHPTSIMEGLTPYLQFSGLMLGLVIGIFTIHNLYLKNVALKKEANDK